jgi:hypothetical protein
VSLLLNSAPAWAQANAQLSGTVKVESGAVLPGVTQLRSDHGHQWDATHHAVWRQVWFLVEA